MFSISIQKKLLLAVALVVGTATITQAQKMKRVQPVWWFGESVAGNMNFYRGTTQQLNNSFTAPAAFHSGEAVRTYASVLTEYRPNKHWGAMLNIAYDNRGGKFDQVLAPCNCAADLTTNISYVSIEPSIRFAPLGSAFYIFAGPSLQINIDRSFYYTQDKQSDTRGEWSDIRRNLFSAQAGAGIDIPLSKRNAAVQMTLSPFASFQTDLLQEPRSSGDWSFYTVRAGMALKFGKGKTTPTPAPQLSAPLVAETKPAMATATVAAPVIIVRKEIAFSIRAPKLTMPVQQTGETYPLLNAVFFAAGTTNIPDRYIALSPASAQAFTEKQLQTSFSNSAGGSRSARQMLVYYQLLNIIGSRMLAAPSANISLQGTTANDRDNAAMAQSIRNYLARNYHIAAARIQTVVSLPSGRLADEKRREDERKIEITSNDQSILAVVGNIQPTPLQQQATANNNKVIFMVDNASELLSSWSVDITSDAGVKQNYGPYTGDQVSIDESGILGKNTVGNYTAVLTGQTKAGASIVKETYLSLATPAKPVPATRLHSILFGFDQSVLSGSYANFLTGDLASSIPPATTVTIFGYTDASGSDAYNLRLSKARVKTVLDLLGGALAGKNITFKTYGFGKDANISPFNNNLPEERYYNRTIMLGVESVN